MPKTSVRFTGICAFVPNSLWTDRPDKVCVLLPDLDQMRSAPLFSLDGAHKISNHRSFMRVDGRSGHLEHLRLLYLRSHRVRLVHGEKEPLTLECTDLDTGDGNEIQNHPNDLAWLLDMNEVAPGACDINPQAYSLHSGPKARVAAQVLLSGGRLKVNPPKMVRWEIPGTLRPDKTLIERYSAHEVVWEIDTPKLSILIEDLASGDPVEKFNAPAEGLALSILNACEEDPLEWSLAAPRDDVDFVWHYELLSHDARAKITSRLAQAARLHGSQRLPYPTLAEGHDFLRLPSGVNCDPIKTIPADLGPVFAG